MKKFEGTKWYTFHLAQGNGLMESAVHASREYPEQKDVTREIMAWRRIADAVGHFRAAAHVAKSREDKKYALTLLKVALRRMQVGVNNAVKGTEQALKKVSR